MEIHPKDLIYMRPIKWFGVGLQITVVVILFAVQVLVAYYQWPHESIWPALYTAYPFLVLAPIYEEIIFRGLILSALTRFYSVRNAVIISSILFGLWHIKNILIIPVPEVLNQVWYAGLILGPLFAYIALKTKSVWFGVMLHYLNNILAPIASIVWIWLLHRFIN